MEMPWNASRAVMGSALWIMLIVGASLGFSLAFACATPFVALAAVAGTRMRMRLAFATIIAAWLGNQATGFLVLSYPRTWDAFGWGAAIVVAALLATMIAASAARAISHPVSGMVAAFIAGFVTYESALIAATFLLPSGGGAFTAPVVLRILEINAIALCGLIILHHFAMRAGMLAPPPHQVVST